MLWIYLGMPLNVFKNIFKQLSNIGPWFRPCTPHSLLCQIKGINILSCNWQESRPLGNWVWTSGGTAVSGGYGIQGSNEHTSSQVGSANLKIAGRAPSPGSRGRSYAPRGKGVTWEAAQMITLHTYTHGSVSLLFSFESQNKLVRRAGFCRRLQRHL